MMETVLLLVWALAFAVANRLRGMKSYLVVIPTVLVGLSVWLYFGGSWLAVLLAALLAGAAYWAGESWGWTKWINNIPGTITQAEYNAKWQYPKEVDTPYFEWLLHKVRPGWDNRDYKSYVWVGMTIRGLLWWGPVYAVLWWFGMPWFTAVGAAALVSVLFPILYRVAYETDVKDFRYLQKAEVAYGFAYGLVLLLALGSG